MSVNGVKSFRGFDGEIIVLGLLLVEVLSDYNWGFLKCFLRLFNKLFKLKSFMLMVRVKLKEDKRAALSKKFETTGVFLLYIFLDNVFF